MNITTKFIMIILLILQYLPLSSQNDILIFEEGEPFFNVEIERIIRNLKDKSNKDSLLFRHVMSKRGLENHIAYQINIDTLADKFFSTINKPSKLVTNTRNSISKSLSKLTHVLTIRVTPFDNLLEFQLILFKKVDESENVIDSTYQNYSELLTAFDQVYKKQGMANFFISPKEIDHNIVLQKGIKKLFPQSNSAPTIELLVNNHPFIKSKIYTYSLGDTIHFNAEFSHDKDDEKKNLSYEWKQLFLPEDMLLSRKEKMNLIFDPFEPTIKVTPTEPGKYYFTINVSDEISPTILDTIKIEVIEPLEISFSQSETIPFYVWDSAKRKKRKREFTELNINYSIEKMENLSFSFYELNGRNKKIDRPNNDSIYSLNYKINDYTKIELEDTNVFEFLVSNKKLRIEELYSDSEYFFYYRKYGLDFYYNTKKIKEVHFWRKLRVNSPLLYALNYNFADIKLSLEKRNNPNFTTVQALPGEPVDTIYLRDRKTSYLTHKLEVAFHKNIQASILMKSKIYEDEFFTELNLDSLKTSVLIPYTKSLILKYGIHLYPSISFKRSSLGLRLGLNKYTFRDRTPNKRQLGLMEVLINEKGSVPEDKKEFRRLVNRGYLSVNSLNPLFAQLPTEVEPNPSSTKHALILGFNCRIALWKLPIYFDGGYYHSFSNEKLPFNSINNLSFGLSIDVFGIPAWITTRKRDWLHKR